MRKYLILMILVFSIAIIGCTSEKIEGSDNQVGENSNVVTASTQEMFLEDVSYTIDTEKSVLKWHGEKIVGNSHDGTVPIKSGYFMSQSGEFSGEFVMDMKAMTADGDGILNHLKSADFFDVENYPESILSVKNIKYESGEYIVVADLTIIGVTNEITFPVNFEESGNTLIADAKFSIDRTRWGIEYSSGSIFSELGDKAIRDNIDYQLELVFN